MSEENKNFDENAKKDEDQKEEKKPEPEKNNQDDSKKDDNDDSKKDNKDDKSEKGVVDAVKDLGKALWKGTKKAVPFVLTFAAGVGTAIVGAAVIGSREDDDENVIDTTARIEDKKPESDESNDVPFDEKND